MRLLNRPSAVGRALISYRDPELFKAEAGRELARETDYVCRSPFRPTNLRMYRQTFWGLRALARIDNPTPPWSFGEGAVIEILPADVARKMDATTKATRAGTTRRAGCARAPRITPRS